MLALEILTLLLEAPTDDSVEIVVGFLKECGQKLTDVTPRGINGNVYRPGPKVIKLFPCLTQLSTKFILLINVKMPTIIGILTFISMINTTSERLKAIHFFICR